MPFSYHSLPCFIYLFLHVSVGEMYVCMFMGRLVEIRDRCVYCEVDICMCEKCRCECGCVHWCGHQSTAPGGVPQALFTFDFSFVYCCFCLFCSLIFYFILFETGFPCIMVLAILELTL